MKRNALGRGLEALLQPASEVSAGLIEVPTDRLHPNPQQPRLEYREEDLAELAASIREHGILQPLLVSQRGATDTYHVIAGERRWRAAELAGLRTVPVLVKEATPRQTLEMALVENLQRKDLNAIEEARAYQRLVDDFGLTHEQIAGRVGKDRSTVSNALRLLKLSRAAQEALMSAALTMGHARVLAGLAPQQADALLERVLAEELSVRETERAAQQTRRSERAQTSSKPAARGQDDPQLLAFESQLRDHLATRVQVRGSRDGGTIGIHFYGEDDLERLRQRLLGFEDEL